MYTRWLTYKEGCVTFNFWPHALKESDSIHNIEVDFVCEVLDLQQQGRNMHENYMWMAVWKLYAYRTSTILRPASI